ncbi:CIA30 family protein [Arenibacter echinorum]|uniref:Complex I intermediate-associated protein 30 (CIA30) n=1 Tax=Arenibacter echinorum TaxID=440515 RepID=A0A327R9E8_9FLAO|nr:CIA30 family protein [Arenibacter echinorum]RAJ12234.1 complex I intermediate-associated protein 30 (CIA30) [Arenibacter echinorum]
MKYLLATLVFMTLMTSKIIFDFNKDSNIKEWRIVNDGVMGGLSVGNFSLSADGHGLFKGEISLENNGGFSSVRYRFNKTKVTKDSYISIKLKGDGKKYQFRVKDDSSNYYSYIVTFPTSGEWEEVKISLKDMYPSFRGRKLDMPNFSKDEIEEIVFLIGNKRTENFTLLLDKIALDQL